MKKETIIRIVLLPVKVPVVLIGVIVFPIFIPVVWVLEVGKQSFDEVSVGWFKGLFKIL